MNIGTTTDVVTVLRKRLEPVERVDMLSDALEGQLPDARKAAVLLGLFDQEGEPTTLFTRRSSMLRAHSGEIAFPGGSVDPSDSSPIIAGPREAERGIVIKPA